MCSWTRQTHLPWSAFAESCTVPGVSDCGVPSVWCQSVSVSCSGGGTRGQDQVPRNQALRGTRGAVAGVGVPAAGSSRAQPTCRCASGMLLSVAACVLNVGMLFRKTSIQLLKSTVMAGSLCGCEHNSLRVSLVLLLLLGVTQAVWQHKPAAVLQVVEGECTVLLGISQEGKRDELLGLLGGDH